MIDRHDGELDVAIDGYNSEIAAEVAAIFLLREGGSMEKLKLVKLMYLAEREHVRIHREPMTYDENFSIKDGPAGTNIIDGIGGRRDKADWGRFLSISGKTVKANPHLRDEDFNRMSDAILDIVEQLSERFRAFSAEEIRAWTHDPENVPEYVETPVGRKPISDEVMARALGLADPEGYARHVASYRSGAAGWRF